MAGLMFLITWGAVILIGRQKKAPYIVSIGGGFILACIVLVIASPKSERRVSKDNESAQVSAGQNAQYIEMQKERIKGKLKDPASAQFSNLFVSRSLGSPVVCGKVNAKNSFGGYGGYQLFISGGTVQVLESEMAPGEMASMWDQACAR